MTEWSKEARAIIAKVHQGLPEDASLETRIAAVDAARPLGWAGAYWPVVAWRKARKLYLIPYGYRPRGYKPPEQVFAGWDRDPATGRPVIP